MFFISMIDYRIYKGRIADVGIVGAIILLALVFVPGLGVTRNDATRWLNIGIQFQPSEIMKVAIIIFLSAKISKYPESINRFWKGMLLYLLLLGVIAGLLLFEPHMSATVIILIISASIMFSAGLSWKYIIPVGIGGVAACVVLALTAEYRMKRVMIFLDPWQDKLGDGWQIIQSIYAIASGGLFGVGLGKSTQKYMYIPEPHNDFIFAILSEELGFIGALGVIALFAIFIWRGIVIAMKAQDMFGTLLAVGITTMVGIQALLSIAVVSSAIPVTGIPLPFFSYGGTALIILLCSCGILLNISRNAVK